MSDGLVSPFRRSSGARSSSNLTCTGGVLQVGSSGPVSETKAGTPHESWGYSEYHMTCTYGHMRIFLRQVHLVLVYSQAESCEREQRQASRGLWEPGARPSLQPPLRWTLGLSRLQQMQSQQISHVLCLSPGCSCSSTFKCPKNTTPPNSSTWFQPFKSAGPLLLKFVMLKSRLAFLHLCSWRILICDFLLL